MFSIGEFASIGRVSVRMIDLDAARLGRLDARIRHFEGERVMPTISTELKALRTQRVAQASAIAPGFGPENIGPVIGPLFERLHRDLVAAGVQPGPHAIATYEAIESGEGARANAAYPVGRETPAGTGFVVTEIPAAELAATTVHYGSMSGIGESWAALHNWIVDNGYELAGAAREVYIVSQPEPQENWVTELQQPVTR